MIEMAMFAGLIFLFGLVSRLAERLNITAPMFFVAAAVALFFVGTKLTSLQIGREIVLLMGEIALVLVLFTDASRINLTALSGNAQLPARLLCIGLPLTITAGAMVAALLFTDLTLWEAAIVGTILAPTDAGLGQAVVNDPRVPMRIRQALNVESGLNDGGAVPFLMLFIALAEAEAQGAPGHWLFFALRQIGYGALTGVAVGLAGGWLMRQAVRRDWMNDIYKHLGLLALALIAWVAADEVGGSGFIAAFVGGLTVGNFFDDTADHLLEFTETGGHLLNLVMFFILGVAVAATLTQITWLVVLYAILSLTLIRMVPVAMSLVGARLQRSSILFLGWFGPRGLASIVMALVFLEEAASLPGRAVIILVTIVTVLLSVFAHGLTASPFINRYARQVETMPVDAPEHQEVADLPTRVGLA